MNKMVTLILFLLCMPGFMLGATTGKIEGKVTDLQTGDPLIGANILVVGTSLGAATDVNGDFTISNLEAGTYEVRASYVGYQAITISNVRVSADLTTELDFQLPAEGITTSEVEVIAIKPLVNKSNTNAIRSITSEDFENLPVRGINNLIDLAPGVILQDNTIYVRGGRQDEVGYYLDGVNITNPLFGGRQLTIAQDAVEEIQIQAGGYTAEFGGANAGIVHQQLKTGGSEFKASVEYITDNLGFKGRSDRFSGEKTLGTYWWGYSEFITTISTPLLSNKVKFFGAFSSNFQNDQNPQPFPGINLGWISDPEAPIPGDSINFMYPAGAAQKNSLQTYIGSGTITLDFNPIIFRLSGNYSDQSSYAGNSGNLNQILNMDRVSKLDQKNGAFNIKATHLLNKSMYYELNAGYSFGETHQYDPFLVDDFLGYGDSLSNFNAGVTWERRPGDNNFGRYEQPANYQLFNFSFFAPGRVTSPYVKRNQESFNFNGALSIELNKQNSLKIGGEMQMFTIRNFSLLNSDAIALAGLLADNASLPDGSPNKKTTEEIYINRGVNNYGYDLFGGEYDGSDNYSAGTLAPKKPVFAGVYIQDRLEYENLIVNAGLRFDYINTDNQSFINPERPEETINFNSGAVDPSGLVDVPSFSSVSPRLGFSFPITDQTVFHAQYGKFVQQSRLRDMYQGMYATGNQLRGGLFIANPVGFDVRPTRTTQYEIGFTQQIGDFASFDITGYYKDIQDQIVIDLQNTSGSQFGAYLVYTNGDFATTKGIELAFNMRRVERLLVNGSVSFDDGRGTNSYPGSAAGIVGAPVDGVTIYKPNNVYPLTFTRALSGNISFDYRFGKDDGPSIVHQLGLNALLSFASGHPYTRGQGKGNAAGALEGDSRFREPVEPLNASTTPGTFQVDLRLDKTFSLFNTLNANIYFMVINVFDIKNVENVFLRTGTADDDGYLSNNDLGGQLAEKYGSDYENLYRALNIDYYQAYQNAGGISQGFANTALMYGTPRQIRFGVRLEY